MFFRNYDEVLNLLKWPVTGGAENSPPAKEILVKFSNTTKYLFLIQEPEDLISVNVTNDFNQGNENVFRNSCLRRMCNIEFRAELRILE